jgi:hypothetical protein
MDEVTKKMGSRRGRLMEVIYPRLLGCWESRVVMARQREQENKGGGRRVGGGPDKVSGVAFCVCSDKKESKNSSRS